MENLQSVAEIALKKAESLGVSQAEIYVASSQSFSIEVENNAIKSASERRDSGIGIRSVLGKKIGFAYVTNLEDKDVFEAVEKSVRLAKASLEDPDFISLPTFSGTYPRVKNLYHKEVANLSSEETAELILRAVDASRVAAEGKKLALEASITASSGTRSIVNSLGISNSTESTSIWLYCAPTVKDDSDQNSSFEYQVGRSLDGFNPENVGQSATKNALRNLGAKTIDGGDSPVIFAPLAVGTLLGNGLAGAVNAEEVQYGRSYISDAFGSEIASKELTVTDIGHLDGGTGSRVFDAEGYPSQETPVLEKGILRSLLHNSYTANKDGVESTGNASRPSYSGLPSISTSNFVIQPDRGTIDDLISEMGKGVLCINTGDRPNMTTGDLSAMVMEGHYVEDGEIKHPVKSTLIGINMRDLLKRVIRVGNDVRTTLSVVSPSLMIESAKITSG